MTLRRYRVVEGKRYLVREIDGVEGYIVRWTEACTGCMEVGDYGGHSSEYPFDLKSHCYVGYGCEECGYRGKVRREWFVPFAADQ